MFNYIRFYELGTDRLGVKHPPVHEEFSTLIVHPVPAVYPAINTVWPGDTSSIRDDPPRFVFIIQHPN